MLNWETILIVVEIQFEPFSSLRVVSQHQLYEKFHDKTKVILDGSGGDEIFVIPHHTGALATRYVERKLKELVKI